MTSTFKTIKNSIAYFGNVPANGYGYSVVLAYTATSPSAVRLTETAAQLIFGNSGGAE
jgi:hypothetical protein